MLRTIFKSLIATLLIVIAGVASAQDYPTKPLTLIIPLGAGGSHDLNARVFTSVIPAYLNQAMIVKLMPGASGQKGTAAAASAKADGYTLIFTHNYIDQLQQHIEQLPYNTSEDLVAVARINFAPLSIVVPADSPFTTLQELLDYGKENPGKLTLAHSGNWGALFVPMARIIQKSGAEFALVPYKGGGPAMQALLAGDADVTGAFPSVALSLVEAGKVRILASAGSERLVPDAPTFAELGFDEDIGMMQRVVMAPRGIPEERLAMLREAFGQLNGDKTYQRLMKKLGENTEYLDGSEYENLRPVQNESYGELVKAMTGG